MVQVPMVGEILQAYNPQNSVLATSTMATDTINNAQKAVLQIQCSTERD